MLGTTDSYSNGCRNVVRSLYGASFSNIDEVSYRTGDVVWVHASHPSPLNGHHGPWVAGDPSTQSRFHGGSGHRQIEEAQRGLVGLEFSRPETLPRTAH
jgi:hypothetical protein